MDDRSTVHIVKKPSNTNTDVAIPEEQQFSTKIPPSETSKTTKQVIVKWKTQTWIEVTIKQEGTILMDDYQPLNTLNIFIGGSNVVDLRSDQPF